MAALPQKVDWASLAKLRAGEVLSRLRATNEGANCALAVLEKLRNAGHSVLLDGESIRIKPPPPNEIREKIVEYKPQLIDLLREPPMMRLPQGWENEWAIERDMLLRRAAACSDPSLRAAFRHLASAHVTTTLEWTSHYFLIRGLEERHRAAGTLPPVIYPDGKEFSGIEYQSGPDTPDSERGET